ncbi:MAG: periplasmic spermidine/putrescine-binding protein [Anaerolineaceae bacterium]|jgi:spermidine/putrescine-binding protein|nr:spermidine/putrescine ABC transporter substrate-binding protein [Anaerolineae bacterium]MBL1172227.1 spermidine/putrescine ABC transporter substrate-binding protein [Chloroflexota bacterium]MBV6466165.1 Spermidine/putrescine-binding periplasmic protein [Anaerolineales bacterium]MCE7918279.1 spermidine/putrescine ABC transporter substrate-binding protein [Chloroflexi bacterium CFX1]MDL1926620.1 spermidine/putrescine ABC transporter substrate-binding protein [Anaerolineae bacterium AMX1]OQY83
MKTTLSKMLALLLAASVLLTACGGGSAPSAGSGEKVTASGFVCPAPESDIEVTSKELNLFVWTEYIPPEWKECFELVYGVKINHDEYSANEEMYAKLKAGGATYDLVLPTDYVISLMVRNGLLQKLDKSKLNFFGSLDPKYLDQPFDPGNEYTIPYEGGLDAIVYNADKVSPAPVSYADLWKPEYAGRLVFVDDSRVVIGFTLLTLGYDVNATDPAQLSEAKAKLEQLIPNVKIFDSDSPKTALIAGDVDLGVVWTGEAFTANQEDPAFAFAYPTEGSIIWQDNWAIPTGAPHLDAAYAWLNYTMQGNLFYLMLRDFPYLNPNLAALEYAKNNAPDLYEPFANSPITNPPAEAVAKAHRIDDVGEALLIYDQIWTEVKGGN